MIETDGHPPMWDPAKIKEAFADVQQLVTAIGRDETGDAYCATLGPILERVFDTAETDQQAADHLAYTLYGATLFGLAAMTTAEILGSVSRTSVLELVHRTLDIWLEKPEHSTTDR